MHCSGRGNLAHGRSNLADGRKILARGRRNLAKWQEEGEFSSWEAGEHLVDTRSSPGPSSSLSWVV